MTAMASPRVAPDPVRLTLCRLDVDDDVVLAEARGWLSPGETDRAARFRFDLHRDRYVRGRGFLRRELGAVLGTAPGDVRLTEGENGKPGLAGAETPGFNLSHSRDLAVLAIAPGPVGVDIEIAHDGLDPLALGRTVFTGAEQAVLAALPPAARQARFFAFWTAKEALMKLTGQGMALEPRSIALHLHDGWPAGFKAPDPLRGTVLRFADLGREYLHCAVATASENDLFPVLHPEMIEWHPTTR
ncbi:4'-phosphopantetheinyl transferase superfamily protein [Rhodobacterales bacterium HKCCE2091]|nr:4'-phosphopantetheinyl transferase superfamily protein [Rhodobacterales bacterium HKCCE2091]